MATPLISLPEPGEQTPEGYLQMSHRALQQSRFHLDEGDRLQASEKVSGSVAIALKAIGSQRAWRHDSHALRDSIVAQLGAELGRSTPLAQTLYNGGTHARTHHDNYYENSLSEDQISYAIDLAEAFVQVIEQVMNEPPGPFTVERGSDAHRIYQLTGYRPGMGATDALGFANFAGELREG